LEVVGALRACVMRYILVNDAYLKTEACCARCCSKIGERYVREIGSGLLFCDADCYHDNAAKPLMRIAPKNIQVQNF
jgi:hypothetical protein